MKKVLWIGPIVNPEDVNKHPAVSPAANKWQSSFIIALKEFGVNVVNISYLPEPLFPKGKILLPYYTSSNITKTEPTKYLNLPGIKNLTLAKGLKRNIQKHIDANVIITYNNLKPHTELGKFAQQKLKKKWVNIVADDHYIEGPDLTLFLSYAYYLKANLKNKMHIDGGIDKPVFSEHFYDASIPKVLLFSGALNKWTGIEKFAKDFADKNYKDIELHIYGKGNLATLKNLSSRNNNILLKGFVSNKELDKAMKKCTAFVNPRPINIKGGENNFPSKILLYLKYGKPIISTKTLGIAPYYDQFLIYYNPYDKQSLFNAIDSIRFLNQDDFNKFKKRLNLFAKDHSWQNHVARFINIISQI